MTTLKIKTGGLLLFLVSIYYAQYKDGIYITYDELKDNHPSYFIDKTDSLKKTFPKGLQNYEVIKPVLHKGIKKHITIQAGSAYAIVYHEKILRYFASKKWYIDDGYYKVEEFAPLVIYSQRRWHSIFIFIGYRKTKYYFSKDLNSDIFPLRKKYLKQVLSDLEMKKIEGLKDETAKDKDGHFLINQYLK